MNTVYIAVTQFTGGGGFTPVTANGKFLLVTYSFLILLLISGYIFRFQLVVGVQVLRLISCLYVLSINPNLLHELHLLYVYAYLIK